MKSIKHWINPKNLKLTLISVGVSVTIWGCEKIAPSAPLPDEIMSSPLEGLTYAQNRLFNEGAEEFDEIYTTATGLGPYYVANSCASCHGGDNRGHLFTNLTRFGQTDSTGNHFTSMGGPQLQHRTLAGHIPETLPAGATSSQFIAPIVAGVGFLELVPDADILAMAQANANNPDGVKGRPNWCNLPSYVNPSPNAISKNGKYIAKFGRKAAAYNLLQQTAQAFNQDMGITTTCMPNEPYNPFDLAHNPIPKNPDISNQSLFATVFYLQVLQTPPRRNSGDPQVLLGEQLFKSIGCETCHKQTLKTGTSEIPALSLKEFHPYTDLLLHDMGPELDDGYTEGIAKTSEWKTTPLWGLGLANTAQGRQLYLLHDGRARSIEEAIEYHNGESTSSKNKFNALSAAEKSQLLAFLNSL